MNLPKVNEVSAFEPHNAQSCVVVFEAPVSPVQQEQLQSIALDFRPEQNGKSVHFFLLFGSDGRHMYVRQRSDSSRVATKQEGFQLLTKLGIPKPTPATSPQAVAASPKGHVTQAISAAA